MSVIKSITFVFISALLGVTVSAPSSSQDPAPGRSPGPPQLHLSTPSHHDFEEPSDLNLSGFSHELNHINANNNNNKQQQRPDQDVKISTNENGNNDEDTIGGPCTNDGNKARKYVRDGETVVAASSINKSNDDDGKSSSGLILDVIHDVFNTANEPLIPDVVYKGKRVHIFIDFSLTFSPVYFRHLSIVYLLLPFFVFFF